MMLSLLLFRKHTEGHGMKDGLSNLISSQTQLKIVKNLKTTFRARARTKASICVEFCNHKLVKDIAKKFGMSIVDSSMNWDILWIDTSIIDETHLKRMKRFQRCNHFPLITELCRKNHLARNLQLLKKEFPDECNFFPATWVLPQDKFKVDEYLKCGKRTVIVKPDNGSNGQGIYLVRLAKHFNLEPYRTYICQGYIANPFLIDGYKFDIRIYVLMTSCDPLRVYIHSEGLARFATVKYQRPNPHNVNNKFMHLTNYAVNKQSMSYIIDDEVGSKRKISTINEWLRRYEYDVDEIWTRVDDVIIKTILSTETNLKSAYNSVFSRHNKQTACFQLLGFDIMLDEKLNPYVLEVNQSPSLHTETELDLEIKSKVIEDTFTLCNLSSSIRRQVQQEDKQEVQNRLLKHLPGRNNCKVKLNKNFKEEQWTWEKSHSGGYRLLYPAENNEKYEGMCNALEAATYYKDTFASQMRSVLGRAMREDLDKKQNHQPFKPPSYYKRSTKSDLEKIYGTKRKDVEKNFSQKRLPIKNTIKSSRETCKETLKDTTNLKERVSNAAKDHPISKPAKIVASEKEKAPSKLGKNTECKTIATSEPKDAVNIVNISKRDAINIAKRAEEWKERKRMIAEMNLPELIFKYFEANNNLSERDFLVHKYLMAE